MKIKNLKVSKILKTLILTGAVLTLCNNMEAEAVTVKNEASKLNIRYSASADSERIGYMPNGDKATQIGVYDNKWDLIIYKDKIGFVCSDYLTVSDNTAPEYLVNFTDNQVITTSDVNLRLGPDSINYDSIDSIPEGTIVESIGYTNDGYYFLVKYDGKIGFISMEHSRPATKEDIDKINEVKVKVGDVVYTTTEVRLRKGPSTNYDKITTIPEDSGLVIMAIEGGWYQVNYNGQVGYLYSKYTSINKENKYRDDFISVVSANEKLNVRTAPSENGLSIYMLDKHEVCEVLGEENGWYYVRVNGMTGYINKKYTSKISDTAVVIDISEQTLTLYKNSSILLETDVVTGTVGKFDTPTGKYEINKKRQDTRLTSKKYNYDCPVDYWMPFNGGVGLHDASWRGSFGGEIYKKNGSHGCVNIPPKYADDVYNNVSVGTKVLVHK